MVKPSPATNGEVNNGDLADRLEMLAKLYAPDAETPTAMLLAAQRLRKLPRSDEPTAWAIFAADTHEMVDIAIIKPDEAPHLYYAEPLFARSDRGTIL